MTDIPIVNDARVAGPRPHREAVGDPGQFGGMLRRSFDAASIRRVEPGPRAARNDRAPGEGVERNGGSMRRDRSDASIRRDRDAAQARDDRARIDHRRHGGTTERKVTATVADGGRPPSATEDNTAPTTANATSPVVPAPTGTAASPTDPVEATTGASTPGAAIAATPAVPGGADPAAGADATGAATAAAAATPDLGAPDATPAQGAASATASTVASTTVAAAAADVDGRDGPGASGPTAATASPADPASTGAVVGAPNAPATATPTATPPAASTAASTAAAPNAIVDSLRAAAELANAGTAASAPVAGATRVTKAEHEEDLNGDAASSKPAPVVATGTAPAPSSSATPAATAAPVIAPARADAVARTFELGTRVDHGASAFTGRLALELDDATRVSVRLDGRAVRMEVLDDRNQRLGSTFHADVADGFSRHGLEYQRQGADTSGQRDRRDDDPQQTATDGGPTVGRRTPFAIDPAALSRATEPKAST